MNNKNSNRMRKSIIYMNENFKNHLTIDEIAEHMEMSKFYFITKFKECVGITPMQFLQSITLRYAKENIEQSKTILDNSIDIGLSSQSRLYDLFVNLLGVTPHEYKQHGKDVTITYGYGSTIFGKTFIAFTKKGINHLEFLKENQDEVFEDFKTIWKNATFVHDDAEAKKYLADITTAKDTNSQIKVWEASLKYTNWTYDEYNIH